MKVIGIHKGAGNGKYNKGSFLKYPIEEFISKFYENKLKNEIICIYNKQYEEINLLHDYILNILSDEVKKSYLEAKNNIYENNVNIYINDKKIKLNYKYKSKEK